MVFNIKSNELVIFYIFFLDFYYFFVYFFFINFFFNINELLRVRHQGRKLGVNIEFRCGGRNLIVGGIKRCQGQKGESSESTYM